MPLPRSGSIGRRMSKSVAYSMRPPALRGALARSTMPAFSGAGGSSVPRATPLTRTYGPAAPNSWPSAKGMVSVTLMSVIGMICSRKKFPASLSLRAEGGVDIGGGEAPGVVEIDDDLAHEALVMLQGAAVVAEMV